MEKFIGVLIVLTSTSLYALLPVLSKKASSQLPPFTIMAISMFVLFVISFIASIFFEHSLTIKHSILKSTVPILIFLGIFNFFAFWFLILGFKFFPIWQQQMFLLLTPILGGIFAYFILGEVMSVKLFIGLAIIAVGLFVGLR